MAPKILIVDDKPVNIQIISRFLCKHNYEIEEAHSGEEAIKVVDDFEPDVLLMDICMPGMDGIECAAKIKEKVKKNIFIIFITALKDHETKRRAFEVGAVSYYNKPVDLQNLLNTIKKCVNVKAWDSSETVVDFKTAPIVSRNEFSQRSLGVAPPRPSDTQDNIKLVQNSKLRDLGAISSSIAHDINNFLGGILGNVSLIELSTQDEEILSCCAEIKKAVGNTSDLTDKMTSYSKKGTGSSKLVNIFEVLNDAISLIERDDRYKAQMKVDLTEKEVIVEGVYSELTNIFLNLLKNAYQAVEEMGVINVNLELIELNFKTGFSRGSIGPGKFCKVKIRDNGSGIPEKAIDHIFEPFFTTKEEGTGLGLSSVVKFIEGHGGAFNIDSVVDQGTTVTVYLPLVKAAVAKTESGVNSSQTIDLSGKRIVIMDDDVIFCTSLSGFLKKQNARVVSFMDDSFNEFLKTNPGLKDYDYLIIDFKSPYVDSLEVINSINEKNDSITSYIISGTDLDLSDIERCSYFKKPVRFEKLARTLLEGNKKGDL